MDAVPGGARIWGAFALVALVWGTPYLLIKVAIEDGMPPVLIAFFRVAVAAAILLALAAPRGRLRGLGSRWPAVLAFAVIEIAIPFPLLALGETRVSSSLAAILMASIPLIVALFGFWFEPAERVDRRGLLGLLVGFSGVVAIVGPDLGAASGQLLGMLAVLGAAVGFSLGPIVLRRWLEGLDTIGLMAVSMAIATLVLAAPAAASLPAADPGTAAYGSVLALGLICTALSFVLLMFLVRAVGAGRALLVTYFNPAIAVLLGVLILDERPGPALLGGLALILLGSWVASGRRIALGGAIIRRLRLRAAKE